MKSLLQELVYDPSSEGAVWPFDRVYIRPPHFHSQAELLVILRGQACIYLGAKVQPVSAGQLCWILPGVPHVMTGFSDDFDMWVVQLEPIVLRTCWHTVAREASADGPDLSPWIVDFGERLAGRAVVDIAAGELSQLDELAREVWADPMGVGGRSALRKLCWRGLGVTLGELQQSNPLSLAQLASCLMLASPGLDRSALAAALGVSEGFLSRAFGREMGTTLVEHRARTRVAHFLVLRRSGQRKLIDAALAAGFGSYAQFHRVFSSVAGCTPRAYLNDGRRRRELLVACDPHQPESSPVCALPEKRRQAVGRVAGLSSMGSAAQRRGRTGV